MKQALKKSNVPYVLIWACVVFGSIATIVDGEPPLMVALSGLMLGAIACFAVYGIREEGRRSTR